MDPTQPAQESTPERLWPCPNCTTPIPGSSTFCPRCGHQLMTQQPPPAEQSVPPTHGSHPQMATPPPIPLMHGAPPAGAQKRLSRKQIAIGAVGVLVALVLLGQLGRGSPDGRQAGAEQTPRSTPTRAAPVAVATQPPAASEPTRGATPTPTPTATPTRAPTPTAVVARKLGSRADAVSFFESHGFRGEMNPLSTGQERWLAQNPAPHAAMAEVIGPANAVESVTVTVAITDETGSAAGQLMAAMLLRYAPGSVDWVADTITAALLGQEPSRRFDDRTVNVVGIPVSDGALMVITVDHD